MRHDDAATGETTDATPAPAPTRDAPAEDAAEMAARLAALAPFLAVILPGMLFIAAFSLVCPLVIWGPLYQFLFLGYWFWGNLIALPRLPTIPLSATSARIAA